MESTTESPKTGLLEMNLDYDGGQTLHEAVRWSKFLSIVGIAGGGIVLIGLAIASPFLMISYDQLTPDSGRIIGIILLAALVFFGAMVVAAILLLRFSLQTRRGMDYRDQALFNRGWRSLKMTFIILGILSCLSLVGTVFSLFGQW